MENNVESNFEGLVSPLLESACAMYELFATLVEAGFTEHQALTICAQGIRPIHE